MHLSVREMQASDIPLIAGYWTSATAEHLLGMGADPARMLLAHEWHELLTTQLHTPLEQKQSWCLIWEIDGTPAGHCNINQISPGSVAEMHLHLWHSESRHKGAGTALVKMSIPRFFDTYRLQRLYCRPYAHNAAPNKTLAHAGFTFLQEVVTTPGYLNFEQPVNVWMITRAEVYPTHIIQDLP